MNVPGCDNDDIWDFKPLKRRKRIGSSPASSQSSQNIIRQSNNSPKCFESRSSSIITNEERSFSSNSFDQKKKSRQNEVEKNSLFSSSKSVVVSSSSSFLRSKSSFSSTSNKIKEKHKSKMKSFPKSSPSDSSSILHNKTTAPTTKRLEEIRNTTKISEEEEEFLTYCPSCQISSAFFSESPLLSNQQQNWLNHISSCFDNFPKIHLKECPNGVNCVIKNEEHYRNFQHHSLALLRENLSSSISKTSLLEDDTSITVDAFSYGSIPGCRAYFLTHFHYDHYRGIRKDFKHPVYCSQVTANLLKLKIGISSEYLHPLPLYCPCLVEEVNVTLLDANHCPGAILILFKTKNGKVILHTGDFRADSIMEEYAALKNVRIHQLFLDTTYCNPSYTFPKQKEVLDLSVSLSVSAMQENPKTLIVIGSYTIGKEKVFLAIAEAIQSKIGVTREKKRILDCQENSHLNHLVSLNLSECKVHVVKMNSLNYKSLSEHLAKYKNKFNQILAFKPTGWTYSDQNDTSSSNMKPFLKRDNIILYGLPYSEHSSFTEMKRFVQFVKPEKILPTVNNGTPSARKAMDDIFKSWLAEKTGDIDKYFQMSERK